MGSNVRPILLACKLKNARALIHLETLISHRQQLLEIVFTQAASVLLLCAISRALCNIHPLHPICVDSLTHSRLMHVLSNLRLSFCSRTVRLTQGTWKVETVASWLPGFGQVQPHRVMVMEEVQLLADSNSVSLHITVSSFKTQVERSMHGGGFAVSEPDFLHLMRLESGCHVPSSTCAATVYNRLPSNR
ncbi:hypothetical protein FB446DRAFT_87189 [Lentinula raphanica]|nr:hypothetical protein FB446DRAFT_87189 [Lentinula raphanica]